jgi:hypothetical protein
MLQKLINYISRKKGEWKSDFFKEPQQKWYFLPLLAFSVAATYWGVSDYPADPNFEDTAFMLIGVGGGIIGLLTSAAELLPKARHSLRASCACGPCPSLSAPLEP